MINPTRLFEWNSKKYSKLEFSRPQDEYLIGFQAYLDEVWQSRNRYIKEPGRYGSSPSKEQRFFTFSFDKIIARNFVGVVQYQGMRIEVYPKIFQGRKEKDYKKYFQHFFYWLSYCRRLNFPVSKAAFADLNTNDFLEALIFLFAHYAEVILQEQPFQAFEEVLEETPFLRGRLAMSEYIRQNLTTGRWQYFQSEYEPLQYDNQFNRIVKYTSKVLFDLSRNPRNKRKLQDIQFLLDEVSDVVCVASDCDKVKLNPLYTDLGDVLNLCKMFLSNLSINNEAPTDSNFCFLLPMEYVFEDFIFSFIKEHFRQLNPKEQKEIPLAHNGSKDVFTMKNDILVEELKLIIDTKYKVRQENEDGKDGVSQSDLYQMLAYAVKRGYHDVLLLYPESTESIEKSSFTIDSPFFSDKPIKVTAQNIKIDSDKIEELDTLIKRQLNTFLYP